MILRSGPKPPTKATSSALKKILRARKPGVTKRGSSIAKRNIRVQSLLKKPIPREPMPLAVRKKLEAKLGPGNYSSLARKTGYDQTHVTDVLAGRSKCSFAFACLICDLTSTSLDDLRDYMDSCRRTPPVYRFSPHGRHLNYLARIKD